MCASAWRRMCVCVFVCVRACVFVRVCACVCVRTRPRVRVTAFPDPRAFPLPALYTRTHARARAHTHTHTCSDVALLFDALGVAEAGLPSREAVGFGATHAASSVGRYYNASLAEAIGEAYAPDAEAGGYDLRDVLEQIRGG